jgi:hypothetical protein
MTSEQRAVLTALRAALLAAGDCGLLEILIKRAPVTGTVSMFYVTVLGLIREED